MAVEWNVMKNDLIVGGKHIYGKQESTYVHLFQFP